MSQPLIERVRAALGQDFEVLRPLGQGGMATVFLARERALRRLVAIKVLDPDLGASPIFRDRFEREAETAAQLQHPNIVPIYRVGEAGGLAYFTMAAIEGESLADRLRGMGRLSEREARRIAIQVAEALGAAHRRGIIHRDVKPQNVLLDRETGRAMVTDFGIASARGGRGQDSDRLTSAGMVMGTPRYMSPEQASGMRDLTPASDLYSLGVVLYEMLSGEYPYRLGDPPNYLIAHVSSAPIPLVSRVGDISREMESTVNRLLAKDPRDRFPTAESLVESLEGVGSGSGTTQVRPVTRRRRWMAGGAALALALGGVALALGDRPDAPSDAVARKSILIGFFDNTTQDPALDWLRVGGVDLLGQALSRWEDLTVVDAERLLDLTRREGLDKEARLGQEDVLKLARMAGVWTATVGQVFRGRDSLIFTVKGYDVARGDQVLVARAAIADSGDIQDAFRQLASQVLELAGAPTASLQEVEPPTRSLAAYRAYIEGIQARSRWDLDSAVVLFRQAVTQDSAFALAYYELSQALSWTERTNPSPTYIGYADSALRYAAGRPPREARLLEAYNALMHADVPRARELYATLLAMDSTNADVWAWRGVASQADLTLRRDANGREYLPADWTGALRDFRRSLELDASDHRTYLNLAAILASTTKGGQDGVPAYREPPSGSFQTIFFRVPARRFIPVLHGDSIALVPAESIGTRYPPRVLDSLRLLARDRTRGVLRRWLTIAPDEGEAWLMMAQLAYDERNWDEALRSLAKADSLGTSLSVPYPLQHLNVLLNAQRFLQAIPLGDSLAPPGGRGVAMSTPLLGSVVASYLMTRGRVGEAATLQAARLAELRRFEASPELQQWLALAEVTAEMRWETRKGTLTAAEVNGAAARVERFLGEAPADQRTTLRQRAAWSFIMAGGVLGDTALVARWRKVAGSDSMIAYDALAAARAGDRAQAERLLARAVRDTAADIGNLYALASTAEALNRPAEALQFLTRLDSARVEAQSSSSDMLLLVRAMPRRAALAATLGDTTSAKRLYDEFLSLWDRPDPSLRPERDAVAEARRALDRGREP